MTPAWISRIKVGDVLKSGTGLLRVVREAHHYTITKGGREPHTRSYITFAIRHCSWTGRCYTTLVTSDLITLGYRPTRARVKLRKKIDRAIQRELTGRRIVLNGKPHFVPVLPDLKLKKRYRVTCCDVEGIA